MVVIPGMGDYFYTLAGRQNAGFLQKPVDKVEQNVLHPPS